MNDLSTLRAFLEAHNAEEKQWDAIDRVEVAIKVANRSLGDIVEHIGECDESDLLRCDSDPHPPSVFSVYMQQASAAIAKLQPFLKP